MAKAGSTEKVVREIRRHTRRRFSAEEKIRIVLEGLRGEEGIAAICHRGGSEPVSGQLLTDASTLWDVGLSFTYHF